MDAVTVCLRLTRLRHHHDRPFDRFVPFDDSGCATAATPSSTRCARMCPHVPEQNRSTA